MNSPSTTPKETAWNRLIKWVVCRNEPARVLVAEDDTAMRDLLAEALRRDGHDVIEVPDGRHLAAYFEAAGDSEAALPLPDLIISDVRMPGYTGLDILASLRAAQIDVPVILISAFADEATHREAFDLGAAFLDKPFDLEALRRTVRALVR